jgi:hypothetical protein
MNYVDKTNSQQAVVFDVNAQQSLLIYRARLLTELQTYH